MLITVTAVCFLKWVCGEKWLSYRRVKSGSCHQEETKWNLNPPVSPSRCKWWWLVQNEEAGLKTLREMIILSPRELLYHYSVHLAVACKRYLFWLHPRQGSMKKTCWEWSVLSIKHWVKDWQLRWSHITLRGGRTCLRLEAVFWPKWPHGFKHEFWFKFWKEK